MKDKFGRDLKKGDIVLFPESADNIGLGILDGLHQWVNADINNGTSNVEETVAVLYNDIEYGLNPTSVMKVESIPLDVRKILRGEDNYGWVSYRVDFEETATKNFFRHYAGVVLRERTSESKLSMEICAHLIWTFEDANPLVWETLFERWIQTQTEKEAV